MHTQVGGSGFGLHQCSDEDFSVYCLLWENMPYKMFFLSHILFFNLLICFSSLFYDSTDSVNIFEDIQKLCEEHQVTHSGHIYQAYLTHMRQLLLDFGGQQTAESLPALLLLHKLFNLLRFVTGNF